MIVVMLIVIDRNEALRLQPPVPSSLQRAPAIGSGGKALGPNMYESFTSCITARSTYFALKDYHRRHGRSSPSLCHSSGPTLLLSEPR